MPSTHWKTLGNVTRLAFVFLPLAVECGADDNTFSKVLESELAKNPESVRFCTDFTVRAPRGPDMRSGPGGASPFWQKSPVLSADSKAVIFTIDRDDAPIPPAIAAMENAGLLQRERLVLVTDSPTKLSPTVHHYIETPMRADIVAAKTAGFIVDWTVYQVGATPMDASAAPQTDSLRISIALGFCGGHASLTKIAERGAPTPFMGFTVSMAQVIYGLTDMPEVLKDPAVTQSMTVQPKSSYTGNVAFIQTTDGWRVGLPVQIPGLGAPQIYNSHI
jgi:hypothetical protein